ncbi:hypothetical protein K439DRAFT_1356611 [Ramaria rubella]|nr:hypothetical protein K439DRAFT_1356611 [Ramaria rubella]
MTLTLETLPVELVADILNELDLATLITVSGLSRRLRAIVSDPFLNPWRGAMFDSLQEDIPDANLLNLSVRNIVPLQNWIRVFAMAKPDWILYQATLPNLKDTEWEECFSRRFLPGWKKWKKDGKWRSTFLSTLSLVIHRRRTRCTADEAWTRRDRAQTYTAVYIILNRNGSANQLEASSRNFSPLALFHEIKVQNDLLHLDTHIRVVVQFADVRILALGVQHKPRKSFQVNPNASLFLHPPGTALTKLRYPTPASSHLNYPNYTPSGQDKRWVTAAGLEEGGRVWVGSLMLVAQLINPALVKNGEEGFDLVVGPGHSQYSSFTWSDLWAIAPWMIDKVSKRIEGAGLGLD